MSEDNFFAGMGKPVSGTVRQAALAELARMGWREGAGLARQVVHDVADRLQADDPNGAQRLALAGGLDLTGYYRLAATILAGVVQEEAERSGRVST